MKSTHSAKALAFLFLLAATTGPLAASHGYGAKAATTQARGHTRSGQDVAWGMQVRYDTPVTDCDGLSAIECSGVLLFESNANPNLAPWDVIPVDIDNHGTRVSFIRSDLRPRQDPQVAFVFASNQSLLPGKQGVDVVCLFPLGGDGRFDASSGCGGTGYSATCQSQGIQTGQAWMNNFTAHDGAACGFTHRDLVCEPADKQVFAAYLDATRLLAGQGWPSGRPGYVTVTPWPANSQDTLRFEAITYYAENPVGPDIDRARAAQREFRDKTTDRIVLPIIRYSHNPSSQTVSFTYREADQDPSVLPR